MGWVSWTFPYRSLNTSPLLGAQTSSHSHKTQSAQNIWLLKVLLKAKRGHLWSKEDSEESYLGRFITGTAWSSSRRPKPSKSLSLRDPFLRGLVIMKDSPRAKEEQESLCPVTTGQRI